MPSKPEQSRLDKTMGDAGSEMPPELAESEVNPEQLNANAQAVWSDTVDLAPEKLQIPFLTLAQGLSKAVLEDKAKMGDFLCTGYDPVKEVIIVPLKFGVSRNYSTRDDESKEMETHCYSPTGQEHGIALTEDGPGMPCMECPLHDWQPTDRVDKSGRKVNTPPPCKESYDFMVWSETHQTLARIGFRSTGLKAGRLLATLGKTKGLMQFAVSLTSTRQTRSGYTYAVPEVTIIGGEQGASYVEMGQSVIALSSGD